MPIRRPINQTDDTDAIDRSGGGGGGFAGGTDEPRFSFGGSPGFDEYVPGGEIPDDTGSTIDKFVPEGRGGQRTTGALPTEVSRVPLDSGGAKGGLPVPGPIPPMPTPSMPQEPTPVAGGRPDPMMGISSNVGGLMGGGIPIGGLNQNDSTSVLDTLLQLMRNLPGR